MDSTHSDEESDNTEVVQVPSGSSLESLCDFNEESFADVIISVPLTVKTRSQTRRATISEASTATPLPSSPPPQLYSVAAASSLALPVHLIQIAENSSTALQRPPSSSSAPASASTPAEAMLASAGSRAYPPLPSTRSLSVMSGISPCSPAVSRPPSGEGDRRDQNALDYSALALNNPLSSPRPTDNLDPQASPQGSPRHAGPVAQPPAGSPTSVASPNSQLAAFHKCRTPIYLVDTGKWAQISDWMKKTNIVVTKAKNNGDTIALTPATSKDFRKIIHYLKSHNVAHHTYQLPEDRRKQIRAVIRGLPIGVSDSEVLEELKALGYPATHARRFRSGQSRKASQIISIDLDRTGTGPNIFELEVFMYLLVKVEPRNRPSEPLQCYRCQRFGHGARDCNRPFKCVVCAGPHSLQMCQAKGFPPSCANCGGPHSAGSKTCPKRPRTLEAGQTRAAAAPSAANTNLPANTELAGPAAETASAETATVAPAGALPAQPSVVPGRSVDPATTAAPPEHSRQPSVAPSRESSSQRRARRRAAQRTNTDTEERPNMVPQAQSVRQQQSRETTQPTVEIPPLMDLILEEPTPILRPSSEGQANLQVPITHAESATLPPTEIATDHTAQETGATVFSLAGLLQKVGPIWALLKTTFGELMAATDAAQLMAVLAAFMPQFLFILCSPP